MKFEGEIKGFTHPTENKYPRQVKAFRETINSMYDIHLKKNQDYSPANILIAGEYGVVVRMWDKMSRICNLLGLMFPAPEPLLQNLIDKIEQDNNITVAQVLYELESIKKKCKWDFTKVEEQAPANEPLEDAYKDMANYAIIGLLHRQGNWGR